jgi:hypothetical protein
MKVQDISLKVRKWFYVYHVWLLLLIIFFTGLAFLVYYISTIWPIDLWLRPNQVSGQVIGATQAAIEFVGLVLALLGLSLASYQFALARRVPELRLMFYDPDIDSLTKELEIGLQQRSKSFSFSLVNDGEGVARFVVVKASIPRALAQGPFSPSGDIWLRERTKAMAERWDSIGTPDWLMLKFNGGSEFICHDHSRQGLGTMILTRFEKFGGTEQRFDVVYEIRAEGMPWRKGQLKVHLVPGLLE